MKKLSSKYIGVIAGGLMISISLMMFYSFNQPENGTVQYVCYAIYTTAIILSLISFKRTAPAESTFKNYFSEGFKAFIVVTLMMVVFTWIFLKINPQIIERNLAEINKYNVQDVNKTPAEVASNSNQFRAMFIPMTVAITTMFYLILGSLVSLIGAALLSQKRNA